VQTFLSPNFSVYGYHPKLHIDLTWIQQPWSLPRQDVCPPGQQADYEKSTVVIDNLFLWLLTQSIYKFLTGV